MFDIGFAELTVLFVLGLLVLGPNRLPRVARSLGLYVRKARATWYQVKTDIERELATEDLRRSIQEQEEKFSTLTQSIDESLSTDVFSENDSKQTTDK